MGVVYATCTCHLAQSSGKITQPNKVWGQIQSITTPVRVCSSKQYRSEDVKQPEGGIAVVFSVPDITFHSDQADKLFLFHQGN